MDLRIFQTISSILQLRELFPTSGCSRVVKCNIGRQLAKLHQGNKFDRSRKTQIALVPLHRPDPTVANGAERGQSWPIIWTELVLQVASEAQHAHFLANGCIWKQCWGSRKGSRRRRRHATDAQNQGANIGGAARKFRSETSDNMDSWKAEVKRVRREKIRRKKR